MEAIIRVHNLRKVYAVGSERVVALDDIDLDITKGQICCVLGTSGSGKSTLLNQLAGLEKPTRGSVHIGKWNISRLSENQLARFRQKHVGFVFQSYNLLGHNTALENVAMPLMFRGVPRAKRNKMAAAMLTQVGLGERMRHRPNQMSGGQQQRVGIARAFVATPNIVFADEPTGNLDTRTTLEVMEIMVNMARKHNQTLVLVTHDQYLAKYADRIITLIDGRVVSDVANVSIVDRLDKDEIIKRYIEEKGTQADGAAMAQAPDGGEAAAAGEQSASGGAPEPDTPDTPEMRDNAPGDDTPEQPPGEPEDITDKKAEENTVEG